MTIRMSFCDQLRKEAQPIWDAQLRHPFVVALGKGTLPERKFKYYILQDARFLETWPASLLPQRKRRLIQNRPYDSISWPKRQSLWNEACTRIMANVGR